MEYLYLILERKILLLHYCGMHHCLIILSFGNFAIVFTWLLSRHKQSLIVQEIVEWNWIQPWWCARNQVMHAHLSSHDIIDFRGKQCRVISPTCTNLFGNCAIVPFILSSSKCQFYRRWTSGICLTWLVNVLAGADGQCNGMSRGVFYQSLKILRLRFIYLFVSLAYTFKIHE